jgi:steroid 5-alpha reductase family enzyme
LKAKLAKTKNYYCLGSMWNYCRNPNHCGEVFCWLGLSIIAHNLFFYHPLYRYNLFIVILSLISPLFTLFAMLCEATLGSEIKNNKRFGNQIDYRQYRKQTSLLWPISRTLSSFSKIGQKNSIF